MQVNKHTELQLPFLSLAQLREVEKVAVQQNLDLMQDAGASIAEFINLHADKGSSCIYIAIGSGNNGGDALVAAINLLNDGFHVVLIRVLPKLNEISAKLLKIYIDKRGKLSDSLPSQLSEKDFIIDGIFGIGLHDKYQLPDSVNEMIRSINLSKALVVSVDTPSGFNPFLSKVVGQECVKADYTISFIGRKPGFYTGIGADLCGQLIYHRLVPTGMLDKYICEQMVVDNAMHSGHVWSQLKRLYHNTNKGSFGTLAIIGGSQGMYGAVYLAGRAALRSGTGKVIIGAIDNDCRTDLNYPELMYREINDILNNLTNYSAIVIGPGLGQAEQSIKVLYSLINALHSTMGSNELSQDWKNKLGLPIIIFDADALNLIAVSPPEIKDKFIQIAPKIITPHPLEATRILGQSTTIKYVNDNRFIVVKQLATYYNCVCILKGYGSLIASATQESIMINLTGNQSMSVAGQGDVLSGIIGSFSAQGILAFDAACAACYLHGISGDYLAALNKGYNGIMPHDLIDILHIQLNQLIYS